MFFGVEFSKDLTGVTAKFYNLMVSFDGNTAHVIGTDIPFIDYINKNDSCLLTCLKLSLDMDQYLMELRYRASVEKATTPAGPPTSFNSGF